MLKKKKEKKNESEVIGKLIRKGEGSEEDGDVRDERYYYCDIIIIDGAYVVSLLPRHPLRLQAMALPSPFPILFLQG